MWKKKEMFSCYGMEWLWRTLLGLYVRACVYVHYVSIYIHLCMWVCVCVKMWVCACVYFIEMYAYHSDDDNKNKTSGFCTYINLFIHIMKHFHQLKLYKCCGWIVFKKYVQSKDLNETTTQRLLPQSISPNGQKFKKNTKTLTECVMCNKKQKE